MVYKQIVRFCFTGDVKVMSIIQRHLRDLQGKRVTVPTTATHTLLDENKSFFCVSSTLRLIRFTYLNLISFG